MGTPRVSCPQPSARAMTASTSLVAATLLHLGFQATVTLVVYPAFGAVRDDDWPEAHAAHSRRIGPVVAVVYGLLVLAGGASLLGGASAAAMVSVGASLVAILVTAFVAAPAHMQLTPGRPPAVLGRLLVADRVRLAAAVVAAVAAVVATS